MDRIKTEQKASCSKFVGTKGHGTQERDSWFLTGRVHAKWSLYYMSYTVLLKKSHYSYEYRPNIEWIFSWINYIHQGFYSAKRIPLSVYI